MAEYDLDLELEKRLERLSVEIAQAEGKNSRIVRQELNDLPKEILESIADLPQSTFDANQNTLEAMPSELRNSLTPQLTLGLYTPNFDSQREALLKPELTPKNRLEADFEHFLQNTFGLEKAQDEHFKMGIAASIANTTARLIEQVNHPAPELKNTNPELADLIAQERAGLSPQLESRLKALLAMNGINEHSDVLYGAEIPADIRQQFELLGQNPHGEQFYGSAMKALGVVQLPPSLISQENLQSQSPSQATLQSIYRENATVEPEKNQRLR